MSLNPISDHIERALEELPSQFKNKINWEKFINVLIKPIQELEDVFQDLLLLRALDTAFGRQLDGIGDIVGLDRNGRNDDEYRYALRFKIFINSSSGEPETLIKALKYFTEANYVKYDPLYPAAFQMFTDGTVIPDDLVPTMQDIALAGITYIPVIGSYGDATLAMNELISNGNLLISNSGKLLLDNNTALSLFTNEESPLEDLNTEGLAELLPVHLILDTGGKLLLDGDGSELLVFDENDYLESNGGHVAELFTRNRYKAAELKISTNGYLLLDDGSRLTIFYGMR